jgi:hypothetical protein
MEGALLEQGFQLIDLQGTIELVYAKIVRRTNLKVSLRVYTGINPDGQSRAVGKDAMRVQVFWRDDQGDIHRCGASKRVHRTQGWKGNLQKRIDKWEELLGPNACPRCGARQVERTSGRDGSKFWGCSTYAKTKCSGRPDGPPSTLPPRPRQASRVGFEAGPTTRSLLARRRV